MKFLAGAALACAALACVPLAWAPLAHSQAVDFTDTHIETVKIAGNLYVLMGPRVRTNKARVAEGSWRNGT